MDLAPAAARMSSLLSAVTDDQLAAPTPCPAMTLGDLIDHIGGLTVAFTEAAAKTASGSPPPSADGSRLGDDWRTRIPDDLDGLVAAWRDPQAWTGTTEAGGVELPGEVAGIVALDELVLHGWDVAVATGQPYDCEPELLDAVHGFVASFSEPGQEAGREGLFGPVAPVPDDAPQLDRILGLSGRDPAWSPW